MAPKAKPSSKTRKATAEPSSSPAPDEEQQDVIELVEEDAEGAEDVDVEVVQGVHRVPDDHDDDVPQSRPTSRRGSITQPAGTTPALVSLPPLSLPRATSARPENVPTFAPGTILATVPMPWHKVPAKRARSGGAEETDEEARGETPRPVKQGRLDVGVGQATVSAGKGSTAMFPGQHRAHLPGLLAGPPPPPPGPRASPTQTGTTRQPPFARGTGSAVALPSVTISAASLNNIAEKLDRMARGYRDLAQLTENIEKGRDGA
ncbi:hypothetical protein DENSPDRAFT_855314 [Dentipellis sp. KUC8613]|nr:hypothetical protein DENSPDRAFT_855314 [Dentipellis sp. KUC8613]